MAEERRAGREDTPAEETEEFPKGIEGPRGDKDAAESARRWYLEQRGLAAEGEPDSPGDVEMVAEPATVVSEEEEAIEPQGGSLGETYDEAEEMVALELPPLTRDVEIEAREVTAAAHSISIASVRTSSQAGTQTVFLRSTDALAFVIHLAASQALVDSGRKFDANFQIIEFATNTVKRNVWWRNINFSWGTHFWISQGNNWGPNPGDYTTPEKWGLGTGLYMYRATVEVQGLSLFSFSNEHVFRVR